MGKTHLFKIICKALPAYVLSLSADLLYGFLPFPE